MIDRLSYTESNKIVRTEGNIVYRDVTQRWNGKLSKLTAKDELTPPSRMVTTVEYDDGMKRRFVYSLQPLPSGGTRVVMTMDGKLKGMARLATPFVRSRLQTLYRKEAEAFRKYVEEKYGI